MTARWRKWLLQHGSAHKTVLTLRRGFDVLRVIGYAWAVFLLPQKIVRCDRIKWILPLNMRQRSILAQATRGNWKGIMLQQVDDLERSKSLSAAANRSLASRSAHGFKPVVLVKNSYLDRDMCKKMKAEPSRLIPRKLTANPVLSTNTSLAQFRHLCSWV